MRVTQVRREVIDILGEYTTKMPFIPNPEVLSKLVVKASQLFNEQYVLNYINPKERKRKENEQDLSEEIYKPYCDIRVLPCKMKYIDPADWDFEHHVRVKYDLKVPRATEPPEELPQ